jgi:hypothetical protein
VKWPNVDYFNLGLRLNLAFVVLIVVILAGNGLVIWQFHMARIQTNRLTGANQQLIAVLQLQVSLLSFHQQLDDLARSRDVGRFGTEVAPLRQSLRAKTQQVRAEIATLPSEISVDPAFMPILEATLVTLPPQLDAVEELARSGDWDAVQRRLGIELKPIETQTSVLVDSIDEQAMSHGHLQLFGRKKNMIVTEGGKNIYPEDIESVFDGLAAKEYCVFAVNYLWPPKALGKEKEILVLVLRFEPGQQADDQLVAEIATRNRRLADYKRVGGYFVWKKDFPRTAALKIKRGDLAAEIAKSAARTQVVEM